MLIPEATGLQIKSLVLDLGYLPSNCLSDTSDTPKTMQVITTVLGYSSELDHKSLEPKTPYV